MLRLRLFILLICCFILAGCSKELVPESFSTTTIRGRVTVGPQKLPGGFISVDPAEGTRGNLRAGPIHADGSFALSGVAVGRVIIRLDQIPLTSIPTSAGPLDSRSFELRLSRSPILRTISGDSPIDIPLDLIDEANRIIRSPRGSRRRRTRVAKKLKQSDRPRLDQNRPSAAESPAPPSVPLVRVVYRDGLGEVHFDYPLDQLGRAIADTEGAVWVDIQDIESACNESVEAMLRDVFHFHPLAIEDALKDTHVPKVDDWDTYLYIVVDTLDFDPDTDELRLHELDLFLGKNYLVTYHNEATDVLERHRRNLEREPENRLKLGVAHLLYRLLDEMVAEFLPAIVHLDDEIDDAQDEVFDVPTPNTLRKIFHVKRNALALHRVVIPMREVLNRLARDPYAQVDADQRIYFRDVYDHLVRIHDIIESLRDLIAGALDTYLSVVSNRTNEIMKTLTVVNVMFLPLTFVAGFFGMNFFGETLMFTWPDLPRSALFWSACALMLATPLGMTIMARRRGWF